MIRCTEAEKTLLKVAARAERLSLSAFVIRASMAAAKKVKA
jgi:uncharacterized protein (DUF1778 family)